MSRPLPVSALLPFLAFVTGLLPAVRPTAGADRAPPQELPRQEEDAPKEPVPRAETPDEPPSGSRSFVEVEQVKGAERLAVSQLSSLRLTREGGKITALSTPTRAFPAEDILFVRFPWTEAAPLTTGNKPSERLSFRLLLKGGDELLGVVSGGDQDRVLFQASLLGSDPLSLSLADVKGILVRQGSSSRLERTEEDAALRHLRSRILATEPEDDILVLRHGSEVKGLLESVSTAGVRVATENLGNLQIEFFKLRGVILATVEFPEEESEKEKRSPKAKASGEANALAVRLVLRDGSVLVAEASGLESGRLQLEHAILGELTVPLQRVLEVAFLNGRARYLSDLDPVRTVERVGATFRLKMPHQRDANVLGGPLRMGGRSYKKGLGVHSYSLLQYELGGEFQRFQATIGLDESAAPASPETAAADVGSVVFRVHVDQKPVFEKALTWRDAPVAVEFPVEGAQTLSLEVDYGGPAGSRNFTLDRADWADARVIK